MKENEYLENIEKIRKSPLKVQLNVLRNAKAYPIPAYSKEQILKTADMLYMLIKYIDNLKKEKESKYFRKE